MEMFESTEKRSFIADHLWRMVIGWVWYDAILFRSINTYSLKQSRHILIVLIVVSMVSGICLNIRKNRNAVSVFTDTMLGFGIYTILAYFPIRKNLIIISLICAAAFSIWAVIYIFRHAYVKQPADKNRLIRRLLQSIRTTSNVFSASFMSVMLMIGLPAFFTNALFRPSVEADRFELNHEHPAVYSMDTLVLLKDESWEEFSMDEKLNILQTVANIEREKLGIPHELNLGTANLKENTNGFYNDGAHEIMLSLDHVMNDSSYDLVNTVAHEAHHAYAYRLAEAYDQVDEQLKSLVIFDGAVEYKDNFIHYVNGEHDYETYAMQRCEVDARRYAEQAADQYFIMINQYLDTEKSHSLPEDN